MLIVRFDYGVVENGASQAKVCQASFPIVREQNICRLEIAVDDTPSVSELQRFANLQSDLDDNFWPEGLAGANAPSQIPLLKVGHNKVRALLAVGYLDYRDDIRVPEPLQMSGFFQKTTYNLMIGKQLGPDHFNRNLLAGLAIPRQQHHAHPPRAQDPQNLEVIQSGQ
jgi:hypothetical protein